MLADLLFPKKCLGCGRSGAYICKKCIGHQGVKAQRCIACEKNSIDGFTHFACRKKYMFDGVFSIWAYDAVVRKALISLKYKFASGIALELAILCAKHLRQNFTALPIKAILVPVPLYKKRENWRGFNQAEAVGKLLSEKMGWKFIPNLVNRKIKTIPQTELKRVERKSNLTGVFEFNKKYLPFLAYSQPLIIFDDVCTTGTTLKEVGKVLKRSGFKCVWGLTIAR